MKFCLKMWKRPKFGIFLFWLFELIICKVFMQVLHIQSQYLEKNTKFSNFSKLSKIHIFPVFRDSTQPSKTICKITNTWNMSPIIKLNIIEYLFLLYINKQLQKKSIKKRNLTFYLCRANRPPLGSWRYGKPLGSLRVKRINFSTVLILVLCSGTKTGMVFKINPVWKKYFKSEFKVVYIGSFSLK